MSVRWAFMEKFVVPDYDTDATYLTRWRLIQTPWFGFYLHRFDTPDPRPTLHDHPWPFISVVLRGGYDEEVRKKGICGGPLAQPYSHRRSVRRLNVKPLGDLHWISRLHRVPTWTLMVVGRRSREWGYLDRDGTWTRFDLHPHNEAFTRAMARRAVSR